MIRTILAASGSNGYSFKLVEDLEKGGMNPICINVEPFSWGRRLRAYYEAARAHPKDFLIFSDAWDVLFFGGAQEIPDKLPKDVITFSAEKNVWPINTEHPPLMGGTQRYRFICAGLWSGMGYLVRDTMEYYNLDCIADWADDQALWHRIATNPNEGDWLSLDGQCKVFQNLYQLEDDVEMVNGRPHNKLFNTNPNFLHGNGKVELDKYL